MINNMIRFGCNACSMNPYGCNVCSYFSTYGTSKATWCCGGDPNTELDQYALLTNTVQSPDVLLGEAGVIPLTAVTLTKAFSYNAENQLIILQPGVYKAVYTLQIPAGAEVNTTLQLLLNGIPVPGSQVSITHDADDGSVTITGQAILESGYAVPLELVSSAPLNFGGVNPGDVIASLMITSI